MNFIRRPLLSASIFLACSTLSVLAGMPVGGPRINPNVGNEYKGTLLYTPPDPTATGGLRLVSPIPLAGAYAVPESNQEHVYKGTVGTDQKSVTFSNLPIARYDLVLSATDHYYVGISLNRDQDSLADTDRASIEEIFSRSVPFFNVKRTEMVKGTPGDNGRATALVQWMRIGGNLLNQNADLMVGHEIRTFRLGFLADVGPGWEVTATRELIRTDVFPDMTRGLLPVTYVDDLNGIRVVDQVKNVGTVNLQGGTQVTAADPSPSATPPP